MSRSLTLSTIAAGLALCITTPVAAAPKKPAPKTAPKPAPKPVAKVEEPTPVSKGGFMVPKAVTLRTTTPAEAEAHAVWNMRAALNVAALQCQFSPFLNTVKNYNAMLKHHADELTQAQATMLGHFKRYDGAKAVNSFDQYTTRTYNSYSTLDAQYAFCEAAGKAGRQVLAAPRGQMGAVALQYNAQIRASLSEQPLSAALAVVEMTPIAVSPIIISEP